MKRYLTGIDWIIHALDYSSRKKTGIGNTSQVVLELDGFLSEEVLNERLKIIACEFPIIFGYPSRAINLCPYWKNSHKQGELRLKLHRLSSGSDFNDLMRIFSEELNKPFSNQREHLLFNLIYQGKRSFLGMIFDHRLMEARGAEAFLGLLGGGRGLSLGGSLYEPSHLNNWLDKFRAGREVNRVFLNLTEGRPRALEPVPDGVGSEFKIINFNQERSSNITQDALSQAGYLMFMPYILSKSIMILHQIFEERKILPQDYLIPVSIDTRPNDLVRKEILFNHLSFFLFRITVQEADSFQLILSSVKEQMYNQIKVRLPQAIKEASFLMRIAPLPLINSILKIMSKGNTASFSFAFVGEGAYVSNSFMQIPVKNIFHLPRVPLPPGLGIFFNQYQGNLNAVFSYAHGLLSEDEIARVSLGINSLA
jgi:hypothetical protein